MGVVLALLLAAAPPPIDLGGLPANVRQPIRNFYGQVPMLPACSPDELARLERETKARVGEIEGAAAWDVAFTMLCGHSRASRRYLEWHTPERVFTTSYPGEHGTDLDEGWLARVDVPAVGGYAWDTRVDWTNGRLGFGFKSDELCYGSFELRRVAGAWLLVQVGDACD